MIKPTPREARLLNCLLIPSYGSGFAPFLLPWMSTGTRFFWLRLALLISFIFAAHFALLYRRQDVYRLLSRSLNAELRFFEFPFTCLVGLLYAAVFLVGQFLIGLVDLRGGISAIFLDNDLAVYIVLNCAIVLVMAGISGLDVYPVNLFGTRATLEHLISITRDLMGLSNKILVFMTGSLVVAWVFQRAAVTVPVVLATIYGVVGFAFGSTGALGARVTDLLYQLAALDEKREQEVA